MAIIGSLTELMKKANEKRQTMIDKGIWVSNIWITPELKVIDVDSYDPCAEGKHHSYALTVGSSTDDLMIRGWWKISNVVDGVRVYISLDSMLSLDAIKLMYDFKNIRNRHLPITILGTYDRDTIGKDAIEYIREQEMLKDE